MANPYFNAAYYRENNTDVRVAGVDAETHYREFGAAEAFQGATSRAPTPWFDIQYYLANNSDVDDAIGNDFAAAFDHFTTYGIAEGRAPSANYQLNAAKLGAYAAANSDLMDAFVITDPNNLTPEQQTQLAQHYYQYGWNEGRPGDPGFGGEHTLTVEADHVQISDLGGVVNAPLAQDKSTGLVTQRTLNHDDVIEGGASRDVLNAELGFDRAGSPHNPVITDVEEYNFTVYAGAGMLGSDAGYISLARASGYEEINNVGSRGNLEVEEVSAADGAPTIGLSNVREEVAHPGGGNTIIAYDGMTTDAITQDVNASKVGVPGNRVDLDITGVNIETLNLAVSNGVNLNLDRAAGRIQNLNILGSGELDLVDISSPVWRPFQNLETLNSTQYTGDLDIDVSGSYVLENVQTGIGNDRVVVHRNAVRNVNEDDNLSVDMGDGDDALAVAHVHNSGHITGLDFTGGVDNVETLEFVHGITQTSWSGGDAVLNLDGFDTALSTIQLNQTFNGNGFWLDIENAPSDLTIDALSHIRDMQLRTDAENLTINGHGVVDLDNLAGTTIRSLDINQTQNTSAPGWMNAVWADLDDSGGALRNLEHVDITSEGYVNLNLDGAAGAAEIAGVQQVEQFTITGISGTPLSRNGNIVFTSTDLDNGVLSVPFSVAGPAFRNDQAATDIAAGLHNSTDPFTATTPWFNNVVTLTWDDFGEKQPLNVFQENINSGVINVASTVIDLGVEHEDMIPGSGFEALEDIVVDAAWDADVYLTDVYGEFMVDITAGEDVDVHLYNTNATGMTVVANEYAHIDVDGNTIGNPLLETIDVSVEHADVDLEGNLASFKTLDLTGVSEIFHVDASAADFEPGALGNYVSYVVGATSASQAADYSSIDMAAAREMVTLTDVGFGTIVLDNFSTGNDPLTGDRLDLSELGFTNNGQLVFETGDFDTSSGVFTQGSGLGFNDVRITDLSGGPADFDGEIVLTGIATNIDDLQAYNMHYA